MILDHVEDIPGTRHCVLGIRYLSKRPRDRAKFHGTRTPALAIAPARTVTVWLAIDDADAENAAMRFRPRNARQRPASDRSAGRG